MPQVAVTLPSLLRSVLHCPDDLAVHGDTLKDALEDAYRLAPGLRVHLCDESGSFRPHVLCFLNDVNSRWLEDANARLEDGDCITILQAVSGG